MGVPRVRILGFGAATPIGHTTWTSAAAARAGICGFSEHPYMLDEVGEAMRIARVPWLDIDIEGLDRYSALLCPALNEALACAGDFVTGHAPTLGLALALPPARPGRPEDLGRALSAAISERYGGVFARLLVFETGHAAGCAALNAAIQGVRGGSFDGWIVAGVDSYIAPDTLEWVEACDQLHGAGRLNNAWGFIPGEAAGAMLVGPQPFGADAAVEDYGDVVSVGLARETKLIKTDAVCVGEGLTAAFREALAALAPHERIHNVFCDLNGEPYRGDEYGFTSLRTTDRFRAATDFVAPADCWGDIGAAGFPLHAALAVIGHRKRYSKGPLSMVWASSESGERGAVVIRAADPAVD